MFPQKIHRAIFLFGAFSMGFGIMMGPLLTSLPQFILMGNWILEGDFKRKWGQLKSNKIFWTVISIFFMHVLALAWSHDLSAGIDDIRIKMPVFFFALVFFSSPPLSQKEFHIVLYCFMLGCLCNTAWCLLYNFVLHHNEVGRNASRFMSHIRLGLYLNMAIACCVYFIMKPVSKLLKAGYILLAIYYIAMMFVLGLASGLTNFFILALFGCGVVIYNQRTTVKLVSAFVLVISVIAIVSYVWHIKEEQLQARAVKNNTILKQNALGREYIYLDTLTKQKENGYYVMINIQINELRDEWKRQFPEDSFSFNPEPHNLKRFDVLLRYLASKGLNKDSAGIAALTVQDKINIQKDISNYEYPQWNYLHKRVYELVNDYDEFMHDRNINGHSLTMRPYFWQAAWHVIKQNVLFGVGTGDVQEELNAAYVDLNSPLRPEWYKRPHNQLLAITVALGITGLLIFMWSIIYPVIALKKYLPFLFWPFLITAVISFLVEDTLESQAGLSFYAVFNTLFLSAGYFRKKDNYQN